MAKIKDLKTSYNRGIISSVYHRFGGNQVYLHWLDEIYNVGRDGALEYMDTKIDINIGELTVLPTFAEPTDETFWKIGAILSTYHYELDNLLASTKYDYNPIENYNRKEIHSGMDVTTYGESTESMQFAQDKNTTVYGSTKDTRKEGAQKVTQHYDDNVTHNSYDDMHTKNEYGESNTENKEVAFDIPSTSSTYSDKSQVINSSREDNITIDAREDTSTVDEHEDYTQTTDRTDTMESDAHTDTNTRDAHTDTKHMSEKEDTVSYGHEVSISGNIGTMSTQNMIEQQRQVILMNFTDRIIEILRLEICVPLWEVL